MKLIYLLIILIIIASCNRKLHTTSTVTHTESSTGHSVDSLTEIIHTLSEAYESLLQSQSGSEIEFSCPPCDSAAAQPTVTIRPDGTKTFTGVTKFKDNASVTSRITATRQQVIDSMSRLIRRDTTYIKADTVFKDRAVKTTAIPWWIWVIAIIVGALWVNERFGLIKVPLLTKK